jgi:hypothetical protein
LAISQYNSSDESSFAGGRDADGIPPGVPNCRSFQAMPKLDGLGGKNRDESFGFNGSIRLKQLMQGFDIDGK